MAFNGTNEIALITDGFENDVATGGPGVPGTPDDPTVSIIIGSTTTLKVTFPFLSTVTGFKLFRSLTSGSGFSQIGGVLSILAQIDTGLTANTPYFYKIKGVNGDGDSVSFSNEVSTTTPIVQTIPSSTPFGDLLEATRTKLLNIDTMVDVNIGAFGADEKEADLEERLDTTGTKFPCSEIFADVDQGEEYADQRNIDINYSLLILGHTFSATPTVGRPSGADMIELVKLASRIKRDVYGFLDDSIGGAPPFPGFQFTNADFRSDYRYQETSPKINTAIILMSIKGRLLDTEV